MLRSIRFKISVLTLIPLVAFVVAVCVALWTPLSTLRDAKLLMPLVQTSANVAKALHELQKERGASTAALAAKQSDPSTELAPQRAKSDEAIRTLLDVVDQNASLTQIPRVQSAVSAARQQLSEIGPLRRSVNDRTLSSIDALDRYSAINQRLLSVLMAALSSSPSSEIASVLQTFSSLTQSKESSGVERATGAAFLNFAAAGETNLSLYGKAMAARATAASFMRNLLLSASDSEKQVLDEAEKKLNLAEFTAAQAVIEFFPSSKSLNGLTGKDWFALATKRIDALAEAESALSAKLLATSTAEVAHAKSAVLIGFSLALFSAAAIAAMALKFGSRVASGIKSLCSTMADVAEGKLNTTVYGLGRNDEIGEMARAVEFFRVQGLRTLQLDEEARRARDEVETERLSNDEERRRRQLSHQQVTEEIRRGLAALALHDFTAQIRGFPTDFAEIEQDFNRTVASMRHSLSVFAHSSETLNAGATELKSAVSDLSARTEQQAANLEETAAALEEITSAAKTSATGAAQARSDALAAQAQAQKSTSVMKEAVEAMEAITSSSAEIKNIISLIDEIAFQTNLLALNAGVEAARAGESGRGFAVVAAEVRELAQRSAEAARQIKSLIDSSTGHVSLGAKLVNDTGLLLQQVSSDIIRVADQINDIAASAQDQAGALSEVNAAVSQLDQITQQNAAMVEQANAACHGIQAESSTLASIVGEYQLGASADRRDRAAA